MNNDWEQFPPIEGNLGPALESFAVIAAAIFAIGMIVYVFCL
jgi:hypothetical protein